jgi:K+-transporting ATPase ATPase C chain
MGKQIRAAVVVLFGLTLMTGVLYPVITTVLGQMMFPETANGSMILVDGNIVGSSLIGQQFGDSMHFFGRPSATGQIPYDASASGGSNLAPTNSTLLDSIRARAARLSSDHTDSTLPVPVDLVTTSGSGLDPHISIDAARFQLSRISRATGVSVPELLDLVRANTQPRFLGFIGEARVNVLQLNIALDALRNRKDRH